MAVRGYSRARSSLTGSASSDNTAGLKVGDIVSVISDDPLYGWGNVDEGEKGPITHIEGGTATVTFADNPNFVALLSELKRTGKKKKGAQKGVAASISGDVIFIKTGVGAHVATHGSARLTAPPGDVVLAPTRALVLRLKQARLERQRDLVKQCANAVEAFMLEQKPPLATTCDPSFEVCKAIVALLRRLLGSAFGASTEDREAATMAKVEVLLRRVDLVPFRRRQAKHCIGSIVLPALIEAMRDLIDKDPVELHAPTPGSTAKNAAISFSELEEEELVLLDLATAPAGSYLYSLADVLARIDNLSHVLAWAKFEEGADLTMISAIPQSALRIVSLPRLKLTFQAREVGGTVRLYSVDHAVTAKRTYISRDHVSAQIKSPCLPQPQPSLSHPLRVTGLVHLQ